MSDKVCAIIGYGPGLGAAYAAAFAGAGYKLALLSRSGSAPGGEVSAKAYACDASDPDAVKAALAGVESDLGAIDVLIYNADIAAFGALEDIDETTFEMSWRVAVLGLFTAVKAVSESMIERGGSIIVSGATASLRGNVWTTAFAPAKAAQRIFAQSMAKQLGPKGVHVGYLIIDGVIDTADTRAGFAKGKPDAFFIQPDRIADAALMMARQDPSAWTFEMDLRPFGESW
ncbi:MAG: SDR family NAD(P)-dependent oxidoreductase [Silicimonas sp.]|nr:SDR family NAD(P)-dependent oxidoreductase [Silicimonas sp.]